MEQVPILTPAAFIKTKIMPIRPKSGLLVFILLNKKTLNFLLILCTAIPYRVSTGPEQGFPCVLFPSREKPVFITGMGLQCVHRVNHDYL